MAKLRLISLLPGSGGLVSGGFVYNDEVLAALGELGAELGTVEWERAAPCMQADPESWFLFDSLDLGPRLDGLPLESCRSVLLVHHLESLFPPPGTDAGALFAAEELPRLRRFRALWGTSRFTYDHLVAEPDLAGRVFAAEPAALPPRGTRTRSGTEPRILMVGNLCARKGVLELLEELARVENLPAFSLLVVGSELEKDYAARCRERLAAHPELGERVQLFGPRPAEEMGQLYLDADLFLSAAAMETFGRAVREAMTAGLPVLLRAGGFSERHLEGQGAGSVHTDVHELTAGLLELLRDPQALPALQVEARARRPPARSWNQVAMEVVEALNERSATR